MKKLLTFLTLLTLFFGVGWAEDVTFVTTTANFTNDAESTSKTIDGITLTFAKGTGQNVYASSTMVRSYTGNTITVDGGSNTVTKIEISFTTSGYAIPANNCEVTTGSYSVSGATGTWIGSAKSVTLTNNKSSQARITSVTVTYTSGDTPQPTTYNVNIGSMTNGSVSASSTSGIAEGDPVTLTISPDNGYELASLIVDDVDVTSSVSNNQYTFNMPAHDVAVSATFTEQSITPTSNAMIVFGDNGTEASSDVTPATLLEYTVSGASYVSSYSDIYKVYKAITGIKFSSSKVDGNLTINLSSIAQKPLSKIIVKAKKYGTDDASLSVDGTSTGSLTAEYADYEITCDGTAKTSITLEATARLYVKSINLVFEEQGEYTITSEASPATAGTVNCKSSSDADKTVEFTITTNDNYEFEYVEVKDANDATVEVTESNGTFSFTMPESNVTITAHFNQAGSLYILGQVNGNDASTWDPNKGVKMNYSNGVYTANVFVSATNGGYFSFRNVLANWGNGYDASRWGSESDNWLFSEGQPNGNAYIVNGSAKSFHLPNGIYTFTVNINNRTLVVTKVENATASISPNGGDVKVGTTATITESGLATFLNSCQPVVNSSNTTITDGITVPQVKIYNSTDAGDNKTYTEGSTYDLKTGGDVTLYAKAAIVANNIELATALKSATFHVKYAIATADGISGGSIGNITPSSKLANEGDEVSFKVNPNGGYNIASVTVTTDGGQTVPATAGENNTYTFTMPADNVTINATFTAVNYTITLVNDNTKGTATLSATSANAGNTITVTVQPKDGYSVTGITVTKAEGGTINATPGENGTYTFTMQASNITVTVNYKESVQPGTGDFVLVADASQLVSGNEYIIVVQNLKNGNNNLGSYALTTEVTQNYLKATNDIELGENYLTAIPGESVAIFTLEGSEDNWMFKNGENYLYNFNTSKNYLGLGTPENDEGVFSITIGSNNVASIVENEDSRGLYCLPNVSNGVANPYFSLYKNAQINGVHLYCRTTSGVAKPVINPASKVFTEEFDATITCSTQGATIYYTIDGTDPTTSSAVYSNPIHVDKTMTIKAIAAKDGEVSGIAEAVYQCTMVENIAEYLTLPIGTENIVFKNPVVVQYHYISSSGKSYIYVKDDTGCAYFHQPYETEGTPSMTQLENGDVIGARFYGDKDYDEAVGNNQSIYAMFTNLVNFAATGNKALAEPELKTVSDIIASNAAELNNHYITINKVKLSNLYQALSYGGAKYFDIYDETGTIGQAHIGYNKFNIDYASVVDDVNAYYNITGIFTAYNNELEFHPTEVVKWAEKEVTLRDLCKNGEEGESYKITNNLQGVVAVGTSLWVKDENGQSIHKVTPTAPYTENFEVLADGNTRSNQADYDQSNWCEIVFPDATTAKSFENKIISGYSIEGVFNKKANPKLTLSANAQVEEYGTSDVYAPNYYLPANFVGSQSCNTDQYGQEGHGDFFFMTPKPQEYAQIVWAIYDGVKDGKPTFIISPDKNRNAHQFSGVFVVDLSMNTGVKSTSEITEGYGYDFTAIIRMVEATSSNAPSLKRQGDIQNDQSANYIVYPLDLDEGQNPATAINTVDVNGKAVKSVKYVNVAGMVSDKPFSGVNIVVTEYTDGSRSTTKMLRK